MNCSAKIGPPRVAIRYRPATYITCLAASGLLTGAVTYAQGRAELEDAASRAQYAFLTRDVRSLESVLEEITQTSYESNLSSLKSYQLAYGYWTLAQLNSQRGGAARAVAAKAAKNCVEQAKAAVRQDARFAEAHAVQAICEDRPHATIATQQPGDGECDRNRSLQTALDLAPKNPRVKFVAALCARLAQAEAQVRRWHEVVASFDAAVGTDSSVVDWGHAEALTMLAQALLTAEQPVAARDAVERALVIAPDFDTAQAVLQSIAAKR
jgi:hypothetical protein